MYLFVKQMDKVNANYRISGIKDMMLIKITEKDR